MASPKSLKNKEKKKLEKKNKPLKSMPANQKHQSMPADKSLNSLKKIHKQLDDIVDQRKKEKNNIEKLKENTTIITRQLEETKSQIPKLALNKDLKKLKKVLKAKNDQIQQKSDQLTQEISLFKDLTNRVANKVIKLERASEPDSQLLNKLSQNYAPLFEKISHFEKELEHFNNKFVQPEKTMTEFAQQLEQVNRLVAQINGNSQAQDTQIKQLQNDTDNIEKSLQQVQSLQVTKIESIEKQITGLLHKQENIDGKSQQLSVQASQFDSKILSIEAAQKQFTTPLEDHLKELENHLQSLQKDIQSQQSETLEQHDELSRQFDKLSNVLAKLTSGQHHLSGIDKTLQGNITKLAQKLAQSHRVHQKKFNLLESHQQELINHKLDQQNAQDEQRNNLTQLSSRIKNRSQLFSIGLVAVLGISTLLLLNQKIWQDDTEAQTLIRKIKSDINHETDSKINALSKQNITSLNEQLKPIRNSLEQVKQNKELQQEQQQREVEARQNGWKKQYQLLHKEVATTQTEQQLLKQTVGQLSEMIESINDEFQQKKASDANKQPVLSNHQQDTGKTKVEERAERKILDINTITTPFYAIQILGALQKESISYFLKKNNLSENIRVYQTDLKGKPWYIVIHGHYSSYSQARDAIKELPDFLLNQSSWVRKLP